MTPEPDQTLHVTGAVCPDSMETGDDRWWICHTLAVPSLLVETRRDADEFKWKGSNVREVMGCVCAWSMSG